MTPTKPFDTYKWRWLSVAPTESLLKPPTFLGVLRVLARHENEAPSSPAILAELEKVRVETNSPVNLSRSGDRNLIRNSGQYWKGTGLLAADRGEIHLTSLGRRVASGQINQIEFAALMVQQTVLPNPATYSATEMAKWRAAGLEIYPLKLILEVLDQLGRNGANKSAYLTNNELIKIVIPLAGVKSSPSQIAEHINSYRLGKLNISTWPDCAPMDNDPRLAREFLLFLEHFGLLRLETVGLRDDQKFWLDELFDVQSVSKNSTNSIFDTDASAALAVEEIQHSDLPAIIERNRILTSVLARKGQAKFRSKVILAYNQSCFLSGEKIPQVLEAAHIIPVGDGGSDEKDNGLCLRVDIHRLFDAGKIRLRRDGTVILSSDVSGSSNYNFLPTNVAYPSFVNPANIGWRDNYL